MNVTVRSSTLAEELRLLAKVIASKPSVPILNYVNVRASDDVLTFETTDMTIWFQATCSSVVHVPGRITLPAKKTLEILEQLPDIDVNIAVSERQTTITAGLFKSRMQTMPALDFPTLPEVNGTAVSMSAAALRQLIERSKYAIAEKTQKYIIDGVLLSLNGPVIAMVATDGKRLSVTTSTRTDDATSMSVLIPSQALEMLTAFLTEGDIEFFSGTNHLFFTAGPRMLISRMIDGQFPQYNRIIPQNSDKHVTVSRAELTAALHRVVIMADQTDESVNFAVTPGRIDLSSRSAEFGDADEGVSAEYNGEPLRVVASGKHVLDFLDRATEANVTLALKAATSPMLWTDGSDKEGSDFLNVILVRKS